MSKTYLLLLGALIAALALQGCTKDDPASSPDPMVDQTPADQLTPTQNWMGPDGSIELAKVEIALGGGSADQPVANTVQSAMVPGSFGVGILDVTLSGEGRVGTTSACPNSVDPATGLPWAVDPCAGNRGTYAGGMLQAALTVTNITGAPGSLGGCSMYNNLAGPNWSICTLDSDCAPNSVGGGNYCMGKLVTDTSANAGFCNDGVTACASANSSANALSTACTNGVCSDNGAPCTSLANGLTNCLDPMTATCNDTIVIGTGHCWTGCILAEDGNIAGACQGGRDLNCVSIQYTGSQTLGSSGDLDANGQIKCSGGPYAPNVASTDDGVDSWIVGNPGINMGGAATSTISIDAFNDSYCIHFVTVRELPSGDFDHPLCRTQCGDGAIASLNTTGPQEFCEPRPNLALMTTLNGNQYQEGCGGIGVDPWNACTDTANCLCNSCTGCIDEVTTCGNLALDAGEDCDPSLGDNCCNPVTCLFTGAGAVDPQATCALAGQCQVDVCDGAGGCATANAANGSGCVGNGVGECSGADTCLAGACVDNDLAGYCTGLGSTSAICNPDMCAAGACSDIANALDGTDCSAEGGAGATCLAGVCTPAGGANVLSMTARNHTGPSAFELNGAGSGDTIDPNDGMPAGAYTGAHLAGVDVFMAVPNSAGALHKDTIIWDVVTDGGAAPTCSCSTGAATVYTELGAPANTYFVTCVGPDLGVATFQPIGNPGPSTPTFAAAQNPISITCTADGGAGSSLGPQVSQVGIADIGLMNEVWPAAGGATTISGYGYCSDGEPMGCDTGGFGGIGFGVAAYGILFNTAQMSTNPGDWSMASPSWAAAPSVNEYAMDASCKTPAAGLSTADIAAGFMVIQGDVNSSTCGWKVAEVMRANTVVLPQPAGTVAEVRVSGWSYWFTLQVASAASGTVNASDAGGTFVNAVTNKHAYNIYQ